ncbi:MAG: hypothetical protein ABSG43_11605 [Solirubrobacteraceae bacterium]|jgi:hypothetical protein
MNKNQNPNHHSVRRIILPSGKCIEVVRFSDPEEAVKSGLHVCPICDSELVQPVTWEETPDARWELTLSCPNCWWSGDGIYDREQVQEFEDELDEGLADMLRDLQRLAQANMTDEIERFVAALKADHVLPEDF